MVSDDTDESAGRSPAAASTKPAWLNNLSAKGSPVKAQATTKKEIGALVRAGVYKLLKKASKMDASVKAAVAGPINCSSGACQEGSTNIEQ